jgi:hypothetical protein
MNLIFWHLKDEDDAKYWGEVWGMPDSTESGYLMPKIQVFQEVYCIH